MTDFCVGEFIFGTYFQSLQANGIKIDKDYFLDHSCKWLIVYESSIMSHESLSDFDIDENDTNGYTNGIFSLIQNSNIGLG